MYKPLLVAASAAALLPGAALAQDRGESYLQVGLGAYFVTEDEATLDGFGTEAIDYDTGFAASALFGYRLAPVFAIEAEIAGRNTDFEGNISDDDLRTTAFMVNGVLNAPTQGRFQPYAGFGVGYLDANLDDTDGVFGYQAKAGVNFPIMENTQALGLEVNYLGAGDFDVDDSLEVSYGGVSVMATYRFNFGYGY